MKLIDAHLRRRARKAGLGALAYHLWHRPCAVIRDSLRAGGPLEQWRTERGRREMEAAAWNLPELPICSGQPIEINVLTGRRFWYQTMFCLWSFARSSKRVLSPVVFDDGTMTQDLFAPIKRLFPLARLLSEAEILDRLDTCLPAARFPSLRKRREEFPLLRKITDLHAGLKGWRLYLDSDMLFFHSPDLLLEWAQKPTQPLRATDVENAYGYPLEMLTELAGGTVDELINTGILGLRSDDIDWERMEYWCRTLIERAGAHYYQEQALVALHLAGKTQLVAPIEDYVTYPQLPEALNCQTVMHHYVANSKRWYFQHNWRRVLAASTK